MTDQKLMARSKYEKWDAPCLAHAEGTNKLHKTDDSVKNTGPSRLQKNANEKEWHVKVYINRTSFKFFLTCMMKLALQVTNCLSVITLEYYWYKVSNTIFFPESRLLISELSDNIFRVHFGYCQHCNISNIFVIPLQPCIIEILL